MTVFQHPEKLELVAHFTVPKVQTWGDVKKDMPYKELVRQTANLQAGTFGDFSWFVFSIQCVVSESRRSKKGPDVENIPKLIVDAFTGIIYADDNLDYVRGVQVEAVFGPDEQESVEVWIYGKR